MNSPLLAQAATLLEEGKVVGVPTDTVYGLASHHTGERELFRLKERPETKAIPVLVGSVTDAERLAVFPPGALQLARDHWPGPLTLVLTVRPRTQGRPGATIGLRMPDHPLALELLTLTGPLSVTSANRTGEQPATSDRAAQEMFGVKVDLYLPGVCPGGVASTVIEVLPDRDPRVLRPGPITL